LDSKEELNRLACDFTARFNCYQLARDNRLLPNIKSDPQPPRSDYHWEKECGEYAAYSEERFDSKESPNDYQIDHWGVGRPESSLGFSMAVYSDDGSYNWRDPFPTYKNCLYAGPWSRLANHHDVEQGEYIFERYLKELSDSPFETYLTNGSTNENAFKKPYSRLLINLRAAKTSVNANLLNGETHEWLFKMAVLRVIAGAIEMYFNPMRNKAHDVGIFKDILTSETEQSEIDQSIDAGLGAYVTPDKATRNVASRLIKHITESGAEIDWMDKLQDLVDGKPYETLRSEQKVKALVREVSLLSRDYLDTSNKQAGRFPPSAILNILDLVGISRTPDTITKHQQQYDEATDKPLSSGYRDFIALSKSNL
jgi:hypothetical protein